MWRSGENRWCCGAAICGSAHISDNAPPEQIILLLNDYAEVVVSTVHAHSGDVSKLVGDGTLAIFPADNRERAYLAALAAAAQVRREVVKLNASRAGAGLPTTQVYLALHIGNFFPAILAARSASTSQ